MTKYEALEIINKEQLNHYNFFEQRPYQDRELVIQRSQNGWIVYAIDERLSVVSGSEQEFFSESDALDNFIKRLRASKWLEQRTNGKYY